MKILLLGKNGQVGWELQRTLAPLGEIIAIDQDDLDLVDKQAIRSAVRNVKPNLIVNAAAYTAVDKAEEEPELAMAVNGIAPGILAEEALLCKAAMIHYSTDYVYDGINNAPYTEKDTPNPINIYGKTKLAGDNAVRETGAPSLVLRTSWVYGLRGSNFLLTILRLASEKDELKIINDQSGAPTWSRMVAEVTALIIARGNKNISTYLADKSGIYNISAAGQTTWYRFATEILRLMDGELLKCKTMIPISSGEYKTLAKRPQYSVLDNSRLYEVFGLCLPSWSSSLNLALADHF